MPATRKITTAATILISVGVFETILIIYAILNGVGFSGGSIFYIYAGARLRKRSATAYKYVTWGLLIALALMVGALLTMTLFAVQVAFTKSLSIEVQHWEYVLLGVIYFITVPVLTALLYHPDTRAEFGLDEAGDSFRILYLDLPRAAGVIAGGLLFAGLVAWPHLTSNRFQAVVTALQNDGRITQKLGTPESLTLLNVAEHNWHLWTDIRATGPKGTGFYYVSQDLDGVVTVESYAYEGIPDDRDSFPKAQAEPALPERSADGKDTTDAVTLLSTSFELNSADANGGVMPFSKADKFPWSRDQRAHSGKLAINVIPGGNPGKLEYFNKSINSALLSSRLENSYTPFRVDNFQRVELEFWKLSTSNPSKTHNCLGSLRVDYRLDGGEWQSKMVYCGNHKFHAPEWTRSSLEFKTTGHRELELRFEYEYPPDTHVDRTVVYLVDDLVVRGYK